MRKVLFFILHAIIIFTIGCSDEMDKVLDVADDVLGEQIDTAIPQWRRVPHRDIMLQVPENITYEPTRYVETVEDLKKPDPKDQSLVLLPRFVMSDNRIYLSDRSGMNIHVFDFDGVVIEEERMSRPSLSDIPHKNEGLSFRSTKDDSHGLIISDDGNMISQITSWVSSDTGGATHLATWFTQNGEHQLNQFSPSRDGDVIPVFYMDGYMYTLESGLHNHLPNFILYGYTIPIGGSSFRTVRLEIDGIIPSFFVTPKTFVTEKHIYVSLWTEEDGRDFKVWTKDGRSIGRCDVVRDFNELLDDKTYGMGAELHQKVHLQSHRDGLVNFHYHRHSNTLYAFDGLALSMRKHKYVLRAFQQE